MSAKTNHYRQKRTRMNRRLRTGLRLLLVCLAFAGLSKLFVSTYRALLSSPLLQVTRIQVEGCERLDPQTVIQQAKIPSGVNILSLDITAVSKRVTSHEWVEAAIITREIPDCIRIVIEERQPLALIRGKEFYLTDSKGAVFARAMPAEYPGLPIITGLERQSLGPGSSLSQDLTRQIDELHRECQAQLPWRLISEIHWNRDTGISLFTVRGGIRVDLGSDNYGPRIARLEKVLRYLGENGSYSELRGIDLTYGNRVYVKGNFQLFQQGRNRQRGV